MKRYLYFHFTKITFFSQIVKFLWRHAFYNSTISLTERSRKFITSIRLCFDYFIQNIATRNHRYRSENGDG